MQAEKLRLLELRGSFREQGAQYGETDREIIRAAHGFWEADAERDGIAPETLAVALTSQTGIVDSLHRHAPNFLDFIRGIASGAGLPFHRLLAQNLMDEDWRLRRKLVRQRVLPRAEKCSSVAGPSADGMIAAQNMDIQPWVEDTQIILRLQGPDGLQAMVATMGGVPSCGVNSAGVSTLLNTVIQLRPAVDGLPVCGFQFECLFQPSALAVSAMLNSTPHATGHAYTAVDSLSAYSMECSAGGAAIVQPDQRGFILRTNHPLASNDLRDSNDRDEREILTSLSTTHQRLAQVRTSLRDVDTLSVDAVRAALSCRDVEGAPVSRHLGDAQNIDGSANIGYTATSIIAELRPESVNLRVAPGPPAITDYRCFTF